jgi:hypothetical protein
MRAGGDTGAATALVATAPAHRTSEYVASNRAPVWRAVRWLVPGIRTVLGSSCGTVLYTVAMTAVLLWGLLFGSIGLGYFIYGKKQRVVVPLVCGLALMVFPYFVTNVMLLVGIGACLIAIPYFLRL